MNAMTMPARLDADMAAILGLEEAFFLPAQPTRAASSRGRALAVFAVIAFGLAGTVAFLQLPSSTPVPSRAPVVAAVPRSLPAPKVIAAPVSPREPIVAPTVRPEDTLLPDRPAEPTIRAPLHSAKHASGTTRMPASSRIAPVTQAPVEPQPPTPALTSRQGSSRVTQSADKTAATVLPEPLANGVAESGPTLKRAARAAERRKAIDAIRALRR